MKIVFLILYLWHASGKEDTAGGTGGPALTITQMPSLAACELVGRAAKDLADESMPSTPRADPWAVNAPFRFSPRPAAYRCVEVGK